MPGSKTKERIIAQHKANALLQAPYRAPMARPDGRDLGVDQPTMPLHPAMAERAAQALDDGQTHYVDVPGIGPLRQALAAYLADMGLGGATAGNTMVSAGVQEARFLTIQMIGDQFGRVALPAVVDPGAKKAAGVRRIQVDTLPVDQTNGMLPTLAGIEAALQDGCKLLYLESPVRLTGAAFDSAAVAGIAGLLREHDACAIWDQGLAPWLPEGVYVSLGAEAGMPDRVAVFGEAWPGLGLESMPLGYISAREDWVASMTSQKQIMAIHTSTPSQYAALKAPEVYAELHAGQRAQLAGFRAAAVAATGAKVHAGACAQVLAISPRDAAGAMAALGDAGFRVADGAEFGAPGVIRLAATFDNALADALRFLD